ncbi:MAG TPA: alpha/beta fold hydrolase [Polyangia bacterium]|jgi:hypothetical protein
MNFISLLRPRQTCLVISAVALRCSATSCATKAAPGPNAPAPATIPVAASGQPTAPAATVATDLLAAAAEKFLTAFRLGDDAAACSQFEPIMASKMPAATLASVRQQLIQTRGPLRSWKAVETKILAPYEGRFYRLTFAFGSVIGRIVFVPQTQQIAGLFFAPDKIFHPQAQPGAEGAITTRDVTVGPNLGATITWPQASGGDPLPAVVLVPGSGVVDRDETVGAVRPFRDLADGLARHGIVTIRYDKRTFARPELLAGNPRATVEDECIQDALAAIALVRWQPRVDPARVFVAGHSLGALLAPEIATRAGRIAGVIMLAAPARPVLDELLDQLKQAGAPADKLAKLEQDRKTAIDARTPPEQMIQGMSALYWKDEAERTTRAFAIARDFPGPLLFLRGGDDRQVPAADQDRWLRELRGRADVSAQTIPGLSHFFNGAPTALPLPAEGAPDDPRARVSDAAIDAVAAFVRRGPGPAAAP